MEGLGKEGEGKELIWGRRGQGKVKERIVHREYWRNLEDYKNQNILGHTTILSFMCK